MSAYVVSHAHIDVIVKEACRRFPRNVQTHYFWNGESHDTQNRESEIGQILLTENVRSVNYRYNQREDPESYSYVLVTQEFPPAEIILACDCYIYQACETPDFYESEAYAIVKLAREKAIGRLVRANTDKEGWSIDSHSHRPAS